MLKRMLIFSAILCIFLASGYFITKTTRPGDFIFHYNVPHFTKEQKDFIKIVLPEIIRKIDNPERYYVAEVKVTDTSLIWLFDLSYLQSGGNSKGTHIQTTLDGTIRIFIGKNFEIIKIQPDEI
jgi:hypothetical protein